MRLVFVIGGLLAAVAVAEATPVSVKGELSFDSRGQVKVAECNGGRIFDLGAMTTNAYFRLVEQYWRLSYHGKTPVLIEVRGGLTTRTNAGIVGTVRTLQSPTVVTLISGRCHDARPRNALELARED